MQSAANTNSSSLSLVICTYNRVEELGLTINSLLALKDEFGDGDELIVINNNSTDNTAAFLEALEAPFALRAVFEEKQGLCCARNRGLKEAANDNIIYFDDDVTVQAGCLTAYRQAAQNPAYAQHAFFGGKIDIDWRGNKPKWWKSDDLVLLNGLMVKHDFGTQDYQYQSGGETPFGASFMLRRVLLDEIGGFDEALGPMGGSVARGDEVDYFVRAKKAGHQGMYLANAVVGHRVHDSRFDLLSLYRYGKEKGAAAVRLDGAENQQPLRKGLSFAIRGIYQLIKLRRDRFYQCVINIGILQGIRQASAGRNGSS